jgi:hypothetical protein
MEASELRIGNLVLFNNTDIGTVTGIEGFVSGQFKISINNRIDIKYYCDVIKPIPLTEEWLLKFGFKLDGDYYVNGQWLFEFYPDGFSDFLIDNTAIPIKHVHQLQNLYHALTQTELVI